MFGPRLAAEVKKARKESDANFFLYPKDGDSLQTWHAHLLGPADSPFEAGAFELKMVISQVYFLTKIYHPNIHWETGEVCLDILKNEWSSRWSLSMIGKALSSLLFDPNADSPLNCDAGDMAGFKSTARMVTQIAAVPRAQHLEAFHDFKKPAGPTSNK